MNKIMGSGFATLLMMGNLAYAAVEDPSKSPLGCRDVGYKFKLNVVEIHPEATGDKQSLYFIYNRLNTPISLYQMLQEDSTRSMYLNHVINGQQWSVLSTNANDMKYICAVGAEGTKRGKIVSCADSIKVCEYARVKYGLNNRGNYWFSASTTAGTAVRDVLHYGIIPR